MWLLADYPLELGIRLVINWTPDAGYALTPFPLQLSQIHRQGILYYIQHPGFPYANVFGLETLISGRK